MLDQFSVSKRYHKLVVRMHVDCERKEARAWIAYGGRLIEDDYVVPWHRAETPEKAENYLRDIPMETWELTERMAARGTGE